MTIRKVVQVSINPGMTAEFQEVGSKFIQRVKTIEPHTLNYEWFRDEDHETCYILDMYRDDEALLYHLDNIRDLYEELFKVCVITRLQVFGKVSGGVGAALLPQTDQWAGVSQAAAEVR